MRWTILLVSAALMLSTSNRAEAGPITWEMQQYCDAVSDSMPPEPPARPFPPSFDPDRWGWVPVDIWPTTPQSTQDELARCYGSMVGPDGRYYFPPELPAWRLDLNPSGEPFPCTPKPYDLHHFPDNNPRCYACLGGVGDAQRLWMLQGRCEPQVNFDRCTISGLAQAGDIFFDPAIIIDPGLDPEDLAAPGRIFNEANPYPSVVVVGPPDAAPSVRPPPGGSWLDGGGRRFCADMGVGIGGYALGSYGTYQLTGDRDWAAVGGFCGSEASATGLEAYYLTRTGQISWAAGSRGTSLLRLGRCSLVGQGVATVVSAGAEGLDACGALPEWAGGTGMGNVGWCDYSEFQQATTPDGGVGSYLGCSLHSMSKPVRSTCDVLDATLNPCAYYSDFANGTNRTLVGCCATIFGWRSPQTTLRGCSTTPSGGSVEVPYTDPPYEGEDGEGAGCSATGGAAAGTLVTVALALLAACRPRRHAA